LAWQAPGPTSAMKSKSCAVTKGESARACLALSRTAETLTTTSGLLMSMESGMIYYLKRRWHPIRCASIWKKRSNQRLARRTSAGGRHQPLNQRRQGRRCGALVGLDRVLSAIFFNADFVLELVGSAGA